MAVRENEDAAQALGVDAFARQACRHGAVGRHHGGGRRFYAQYFLFIDAGIAYGPWISVEALLAPIIGGIGTVFGPLLGALVLHSLGEGTKLVTGDAPGLDLVIYGACWSWSSRSRRAAFVGTSRSPSCAALLARRAEAARG